MKLTDRFERIFIINLAHRADRRQEMAAELARVGLSFSAPEVVLFDAVRPSEPGGFESVGARGCFMSHLGILHTAIGLKSVLILEDDLSFVDRIGEALPRALAALPDDWDLFYGGCRIDVSPSPAPITLIKPDTPLGTTHFIAFNGPVIAPAAAYLEAILTRAPGDPKGGPMHVDGAYSHLRADHASLRTWVALPELGYQRPSRTDIHALRWFDRWPGLRDVVQGLRRWRGSITHGS